MNMGNQLYELRKSKNLSQEEVAEKLHVTRQTISKWETNQSVPDLDKIVPLCELYEIETDALLRGNFSKKEKEEFSINSIQREKAKVISISFFLYFLSIIWIIMSELIENMNENIQVGVFLLICAIPTVYLIYKLMLFPKEEKKTKRYEEIDKIISLAFITIYLLISFLTNAWEVTWIIWLIYVIFIAIIHTILDLKGESNEK